MNEVQFIIDFLSSPIFYGGSIFASFVWLLEHPDIYDRIKALFIKPFMSGRKKLQQHYLASDIQSKLNRFSRHVIKDLDEKERFKAKIQWVEDSTRDTFFNQDKIVIKMDCSDNSNRNLAIATLAYASEVVIRKCKPYLEPRLRNATNLIAAKKIIDGYAEEQEKNYYNNVFLFPTLEADTNLRDDCNYLSILDQNGYFTRLYLRELRYLGELLDGTIPTEDIQQETRNFFEYLSHIGCTPIIHVGGHYLNDNQFNLLGRYLKIRVLLLAITSNIENKNIKPYVKRIKEGLRQGCETFYILATEKTFDFLKIFKKDLERRLVKQKILKLTCDRTYFLKKSPSIKQKHRCIIYRKIGTFDDKHIEEIFEDIDNEETNQ